MIVNPGIRRFLGSAIQRLFNSASFYAPLTHTLALERGTGSPTFTRASTATFTDWEGVLRTVPSGCARFEGARMVRNWIQAPTENWASVGWTKSGISVSGNRLTATGANGVIYDNAALGMGTGITAVGSVTLSRVTGTGNVDISTNGGTTWTTVSVTGARVSVSLAGNINGQFAIRIVTSGDAIDATYPQLEDVTGQADQTASEYVSVGVLSDPWHGAGVDGVKCFNTDIAENAIPSTTLLGYLAEGARTNLCLQSQTFDSWTDSGATVTANSTAAPDGTTTADTITRVAGQGDARYVTLTLASNAVHAVSLWIKKGTSPSSLLALYDATAIVYRLRVDITWSGTTPSLAFTNGSLVRSTEWTNGLWRVEVLTEAVVAANTNRLYLYPGRAGSANGETVIAWGAQVELGPFASSYIATTTTAVTGNVDVESVSTSGNIAAAAGSIYLEYTPTHTPSGTIALWGTYVDASNYTAILHDATNLIFRKRIAGVNYDATIANAFVAGTTYKACATWGAAGTSITLNGTEGTPHANTTAAQIAATMQWGADGNGGSQPFMALKYGYIGQRQLSASELLAITS